MAIAVKGQYVWDLAAPPQAATITILADTAKAVAVLVTSCSMTTPPQCHSLHVAVVPLHDTHRSPTALASIILPYQTVLS